MKIKNFGDLVQAINSKKLILIACFSISIISFSQTSSVETYDTQLQQSQVVILQSNPFNSLEEYLQNNAMMNRRGILLQKLYFEKNNSVYLNSNGTLVLGANPVCLFATLNTFPRVMTDTFNRSTIQMINLTINSIVELSDVNFSDIENFPNLTYIIITITVPVTSTNFTNIELSDLPNVEYIYHYQNPS